MVEENISEEQQIGFHKGALSTLVKEREEVMKMLSIVESLIQAHIKALKELGVDIEAEAKKVKKQMEREQGRRLDERIA